ncbi:MAG: cytochrome c, mono- and diheme variant family, partial [Rhizobacter sp.]|nr:cytochrome c, mono- and diheme variant family [Rhizobacter sp.]
VQIVLHGMTAPIDVAGTTYNGAMPAFGERMSDADLAAVLSCVRQEWGNASPPVAAELVTAARKATADRTEPWSGIQELQNFLATAAAKP